MHNHVKVDHATSGHPEGTVALTVYGRTVILMPVDAREIAAELMKVAGPLAVPAKPVQIPAAKAPAPTPPPSPPVTPDASAA
jgi:hypothetical protein